jgi:hypothetical protein
MPNFLSREELQDIDPSMNLLFVDYHRCPYSKSIVQELAAANSETGKHVLHYIDIGKCSLDELQDTWLPGVPCLLSQDNVFLGLDAFTKCRELVRTLEGTRFVEVIQ